MICKTVKMVDLFYKYGSKTLYIRMVIITLISIVFLTANNPWISNTMSPVSEDVSMADSRLLAQTFEESSLQEINETIRSKEALSFDIIVAPDISRVEEDTMIAFVPSHPTELKERNAIRRSWANSDNYKKANGKRTLVTIFAIGAPCTSEESHQCETGSTEREIMREVQSFQDILLLNMSDTYNNMVTKIRMSMEYISLHARAKYILKIDSDVMPNTFSWLRVVKTLLAEDASCLIVGVPLVNTLVGRIGKFGIPEEDYNLPRYPNYVGGAAYLMSRDAIVTILNMTSHTKYFKMEDVFYTGIAVVNTHIHLLGMPNTTYIPLYTIPEDFSTILKSMEGALMAHNIPENQWWNMWGIVQSHNNYTDGNVTFRFTDITEKNPTLPMRWILRNYTNNMCTYKKIDLDNIG